MKRSEPRLPGSSLSGALDWRGRLFSLRRRRVSLIRQASASDCGAACLAMVLGHLGKHVRVEEVRERTGFGRDAISAKSLLDAGFSYGLRCRALHVAEVSDLQLLPAPCILHWRFNHFVVLVRATRRFIEVADPVAGPLRFPLAEVGRSFTGVALTFEPGVGFEPGKPARSRLWPLLRELIPRGSLVAKVLASSLLLLVLAIAVPLIIGLIVDQVVPEKDYDLLAILAIGGGGVVLLTLLGALVRAHLLIHLRTRIEAKLTSEFVEHLLRLPYAFFHKRSEGDLMSRLNSNTTLREYMASGGLSSIIDGALASIYLVPLLVASPPIGALVLVLAAIRICLVLLGRRSFRRLTSEILERQAESHGFQVQLLSGIETVKAGGLEQQVLARWNHLFAAHLNCTSRQARLNAWVDSISQALTVASPLLILLYGAHLVLLQQLSLGMMLAANVLAVGFLSPLSQLVRAAFDLERMKSLLDRIGEVLETPAEVAQTNPPRTGSLKGKIALETVCFRYSPSSPPVVEDVSLEVPAGSLVALVGRSGAGKSTLLSLLLGLFPVERGRIVFDGLDLAEIDRLWLRSQIGTVLQKPHLFDVSIRENIAFGDPSLSLAQVVEAAKRAHIHDEISAMPMGYETRLTHGGASLSGGQQQRVALARALIRNPRILLLDEATSALDSITEAQIYQELASLRCTKLVVAHRLSTVRRADLIVVLEQGRLVETGTHDRLASTSGIYSALLAEQTGG